MRYPKKKVITMEQLDNCIEIFRENTGNLKKACYKCAEYTGQTVGAVYASYMKGKIRNRLEEKKTVLFFTKVDGVKYANRKNILDRHIEKSE